jgi:hypothetical protein
MKKYRYLYNIAFFHSCGNGSVQLLRKTKINSLAELCEVKKYIEETNNLKKVAIINYQLISKNGG